MSQWFPDHVVLCGAETSQCKGWSDKGTWTCKHFIRHKDFMTLMKTPPSRSQSLCKDIEAMSGRDMITRLAPVQARRLGLGLNRARGIHPGMQWASDLAIQDQFGPNGEDVLDGPF